MRDKLRTAIFILATAAALVAVFASRPSAEANEAVVDALLDAEIDNDRAEGAPQQQVVNGWVARDLLAIQSKQLDDLNATLWGLSWLLAIAVALLGWQVFDRRRRDPVDGPAEGPATPPRPAARPAPPADPSPASAPPHPDAPGGGSSGGPV